MNQSILFQVESVDSIPKRVAKLQASAKAGAAQPVPSIDESPETKLKNTVIKQVPNPIERSQERTRALLAFAIALGLGSLLLALLSIGAVHQRRIHALLNQQSSKLTAEQLVDLQKQQDQAVQSLMSQLVTAGFSTLGTALGFYFSKGSSSKG